MTWLFLEFAYKNHNVVTDFLFTQLIIAQAHFMYTDGASYLPSLWFADHLLYLWATVALNDSDFYTTLFFSLPATTPIPTYRNVEGRVKRCCLAFTKSLQIFPFCHNRHELIARKPAGGTFKGVLPQWSVASEVHSRESTLSIVPHCKSYSE